jgi:hypothetical protein
VGEYCVWRTSWWQAGLCITYIQRATSSRPSHISPTNKLLIACAYSTWRPPRLRRITRVERISAGGPEFKDGHRPRHTAAQRVSKTGVLQINGNKHGQETKATR